MKIEVLQGDKPNTGKFIGPSGRIVNIKRGRYILDDSSHPLLSEKVCYFRKIYCLEYKNRVIYSFDLYGITEGSKVIHVGLTKWQNQRFLWLQNRHWLQKEENIRYIINIMFLIFGAYLGIMKMK